MTTQNPDIVSVIRVLVYTGTRKAVQEQLSLRQVIGTQQFQNFRIDEASIGSLPFQDMTTFLSEEPE